MNLRKALIRWLANGDMVVMNVGGWDKLTLIKDGFYLKPYPGKESIKENNVPFGATIPSIRIETSTIKADTIRTDQITSPFTE